MAVSTSTLGRRAWVRSLVSMLAFAGLLFAPAGSLRFWQGWLYGFVFVTATAAISIYLLKHDPKLVERRMQAGPTAEREPTQKVIVTIILVGFILLIVLPGLDLAGTGPRSHHGSYSPPTPCRVELLRLLRSYSNKTASRRRRSRSRRTNR